jgi:WD40 repeat protein
VFAVVFHPYGRRILSGGVEGVVKVWDVLQSRPVIYRGHSGWVTGAAFRQDDCLVATESDMWRAYLACGTATEELRKRTQVVTRFWDPDTGHQVPPPAAHVVGQEFGPFSRFAEPAVTSPDRRWIARVAPFDANAEAPSGRDVQLTDAASGRVVRTLVGHTDFVECVAFCPDGRRIATSGSDRTIKLWDIETGQEVLTLRDHTASVTCVAFSPDGHRLVSGSIDHTARIWDATPLESETPPGANAAPARENP